LSTAGRPPNHRRRCTLQATCTALLAAAALPGCSLLPPAAPPPVVYDFGLAPALPAADAAATSLPLVPTTAPAWLDGTAMLYRLAYRDGAQLASYRDSRWAAPPAALLHERLRQRLVHFAPAAGAVTLRIELEEFSQVFDTPAGSRAVVRLRAALLAAGTGRLLRQKAFAEEAPSASADAPGGARALVQATDAVLARVLAWARAAP